MLAEKKIGKVPAPRPPTLLKTPAQNAPFKEVGVLNYAKHIAS